MEHIIVCPKCSYQSKTEKLQWCDCSNEGDCSLICPNCSQCFCKSPRAFRNGFWSNASENLHHARMTEKIRRRKEAIEKSVRKPKRPLLLVVEDDAGIRDDITRTVEGMSYGLIFASNGVEAFNMARQHLPDLILTDSLIPMMDTRELCRRLKEAKETRNIKIIVIISIFTMSRQKLESLKEFHADGFLKKPVETTDLTNLLEKFMDVANLNATSAAVEFETLVRRQGTHAYMS